MQLYFYLSQIETWFFFAQDPYMDEDDLALVVSIYFSNSNP